MEEEPAAARRRSPREDRTPAQSTVASPPDSERASGAGNTESPSGSGVAPADPGHPARSLVERLSTWVPMVTAVAALALSFVTWLQSQRTPEVSMNLPSIVRIGADTSATFDVYLQPSFSVPRAY